MVLVNYRLIQPFLPALANASTAAVLCGAVAAPPKTAHTRKFISHILMDVRVPHEMHKHSTARALLPHALDMCINL